MTLNSLPAELTLTIARYLSEATDIISCTSISRKSRDEASPALYEYNYGYAINWALKHGRMDIVDRAIEIGLHLFRLSHLIKVAATGNVQLAKTILQSHKLITDWKSTARDSDQLITPLVTAAAHGSIEMMQLILDVPGVQTHRLHGWRAVCIASLFRRYDTVQLLLAHSLDPRSQRGPDIAYTSLRVAAGMGDLRILTALVEHSERQSLEPSFLRRHVSHALRCVAGLGQLDKWCKVKTLNLLTEMGIKLPEPGTEDEGVECAEFLLAHGADVEYRDRSGDSPLAVAITADNTAIALALIERGADISVQTWIHGRRKPLVFAAAGHSNVQLIQAFLDRGAEIVLEDGGTMFERAVDIAVEAGHPEVARLLLSRTEPCDVNALVSIRGSLLHLAAASGSYDTFKLIVDAGADPQCRSPGGYTPLHLANHPDIARALLEKGTPVDIAARGHANRKDGQRCLETPLLRACSDGRGSVVPVLLEAGADPSVIRPDGCTALHAAAWSGLVEAVALLGARVAHVDQPCHSGDTPLQYAIRGGHADVVEQLLSLGADPKLRTKRGFTLLDREETWSAVRSP